MTTKNINVDGYKYHIIKIIETACNDEVDLNGWLHTATEESFKSMLEEIETRNLKAQQGARKNEWVLQALRNCLEQPILNIEGCTAAAFMRWLQSVRDTDRQFLSKKSAYGNKCAALHHLFRCHPIWIGILQHSKEN